MDFLHILDEFIEDTLTSGFTEEQIAKMLLEEDRLLQEGDKFLPIIEAVHRVRRTISGVRITTRKFGRKDPRRSQLMKRVARTHRASRLMAARKYQRSPKAKRVRRIVMQRRRTMHPMPSRYGRR